MALKNALGDIALDQSVQTLNDSILQLLAAIEAQGMEIQRPNEFFPPRALQYARDVSDQMRVVIGNEPTIAGLRYLQMWSGSTYANWYTNGGPNSMDMRENQREMSQQTFNNVRNGRWVIT